MVEEPAQSEQTGKLDPEKIKELRELAMGDLFLFAKGVLGFDWFTEEIHKPLCRKLELYPEWERDGELRHHEKGARLPNNGTNMKIKLPRGWLKTTMCSQAYPIWRAVRNCNIRVLLTQNTKDNAVKKLIVMDDVFLNNQLFRLLFPELIPRNGIDTWNKDSKCVHRTKALPEGTFDAAGTRTGVVSRHYDLIIEDDTVAPDLDAMGVEVVIPSKNDIDKAIGYHRLVPGLLVHHKESQNLVVGTRWYVEDLLKWIETKEKTLFEHYDRAVTEDKDGNPDPKGEIQYPERFDQEVLDGLKMKLGSYMYRCLYLNQPVLPDEMSFKPEWFQYYETLPKQLAIHTTVDTAGDPEDSKGVPDYCVVMTTGKCLSTGRIYVIDYFRQQCNPGELVQAIFDHVKLYSPLSTRIEAVGYQYSLKHWIRERQISENFFFNVDKVSTNHSRLSKNAKIMGLQPLFEAKQVFFRNWMTELATELQSFPMGAFDDIADALSSQLDLWAHVRVHKRVPEYGEGGVFDAAAAMKEIEDRGNKGKSLVFQGLKSGRGNELRLAQSNEEWMRKDPMFRSLVN